MQRHESRGRIAGRQVALFAVLHINSHWLACEAATVAGAPQPQIDARPPSVHASQTPLAGKLFFAQSGGINQPGWLFQAVELSCAVSPHAIARPF